MPAWISPNGCPVEGTAAGLTVFSPGGYAGPCFPLTMTGSCRPGRISPRLSIAVSIRWIFLIPSDLHSVPRNTPWPQPNRSPSETQILQRRGGQPDALPLVRAIVGDIVRQSRLVDGLQQRLSAVLSERRRPSDDPYSEELAQTQNELEIEEEKLQPYIDELKNLGVELKGDETACATSAA